MTEQAKAYEPYRGPLSNPILTIFTLLDNPRLVVKYREAAEQSGYKFQIVAQPGELYTFRDPGDANYVITMMAPEHNVAVAVTRPADQNDHSHFHSVLRQLRAESV